MPEGDNQAASLPPRAGEQLRVAREAQGLDLADIAARTRIPQRHLASIEAGNYSGLPSTTYATGFSRAYARAVGIDDVALVNAVRGELAQSWNRPAPVAYEPDDPARVPSAGVVWLGVLAAAPVLIFAGLYFGTNLFRGGVPASVASPSGDVATNAVPVPAPSAAPVAATATGQVSLTATDEVWLRVYDAANTTLVMRTLAKGERYDVPQDADRPMINVGRPDKLAVTVNGSTVAPLGSGRVAIKDVPIGAGALMARGSAPAAGDSL